MAIWIHNVYVYPANIHTHEAVDNQLFYSCKNGQHQHNGSNTYISRQHIDSSSLTGHVRNPVVPSATIALVSCRLIVLPFYKGIRFR